jgi:uncharacterized Ntn-hydrolase superfamily protein
VTFSIIARCADSGMFGMAIASSSPAVAARCAHVRAGVGVVASQNITDPSLGPRILQALAAGTPSDQALAQALAATPFAAYRQVLVIGKNDPPVIHSGDYALGIVGTVLGAHAAAAGNLLATSEVPKTMIDAFEGASGHMGARLLTALQAGRERGGEAGPIHSAGLLIVSQVSWPIVDLRVDWSVGDPVADLTAIWGVYAPQIDDYVRRATDPRSAPSFGVPGNL